MDIRLISDVLSSKVSFSALVKEMKKYNKEDHVYQKKARVAVVGSSSVQYFTAILKFVLNLHGIDAEMFESDYDGISSCLLNMDPELEAFAPQFVVVLPYYQDIKEYPSPTGNGEQFGKLLDAAMQRQTLIWKNLSRISNIQVFQCNYVVPYIDELGSYEANTINSKNNYLREINRRLLLEHPTFVTMIDLDAFAAQVGKEKWFDFAGYFSTKSGFSLQYLLPVTNKIGRLINASVGKVRKCLVLDLDNTLWGDVVGDVGANGVVLDPNDPEGEAYRFFQTYIKQLKERGVILAVCSKNDEDVAKEVFRSNSNMVLTLDDISCFVANWDNKATNIERIAKTLNIGLDSLVFVDDNRAEREIVRQNLPEVLVVDIPENAEEYAPALYNTGAFDWLEITEEDILRSNSYVANAKREELLNSNVDYGSYLESLEMEARIVSVREDNIERFVQLINKSNQFNLTTRRTNEKQVREKIENNQFSLRAVYLKDRFSYYGNIACVILRQEGKSLIVDTFVMSCRVLKRGLEDLILSEIIQCAQKKGCQEIIGEYIQTERNGMVSKLYDEFGFEVICEEAGMKRYRLLTENYTEPIGNYIRLM